MDNTESRTLTSDEMKMINRLRRELCESGAMDSRTAFSFALSVVQHKELIIGILTEK